MLQDLLPTFKKSQSRNPHSQQVPLLRILAIMVHSKTFFDTITLYNKAAFKLAHESVTAFAIDTINSVVQVLNLASNLNENFVRFNIMLYAFSCSDNNSKRCSVDCIPAYELQNRKQ